MAKKKNSSCTQIKQRDGNIVASYKREINLQTRSVQDKKKYNRKEKHKTIY